MSIDKSTVEKIARLARLSLGADEIPEYSRELSHILDLVEAIDQSDTGSISAIAHPLDIESRLRTDEVSETNQRDYFQQQAPLTDAGYYLVPRVIE